MAERGALGRGLEAVARVLAIIGGFVLVAMAVLTTASISGRALDFLGLGPIRGDIEMVEVGAAIAVFLFLPWAQMRRAHVTVDVLVDRFPAPLRAFLTMTGHLLLAVAAAIITWRIALGLGERIRNGDETFIIGFPIWPGYAAGVVGAGLFAVIALYTAWGSARHMVRGTSE